MLIESLEKKTKLAMFTVLLAVSASTVICGLCFYFATKLVRDQQQQVYVLDGSIPFMAERSKNEMTFDIEAKAHIQLFHQYFFNLSPDDEYLKWSDRSRPLRKQDFTRSCSPVLLLRPSLRTVSNSIKTR